MPGMGFCQFRHLFTHFLYLFESLQRIGKSFECDEIFTKYTSHASMSFSRNLRMLTGKKLIIASVALATTAGAATMLAGTATGPSSSASPYVINVPTIVDITSILTVGDSVSDKPVSDKPGSATPYRMVENSGRAGRVR